MLKNVSVELVSNFVKVIHVELPNEGRKVFMAEVDRQDFLFEFVDV